MTDWGQGGWTGSINKWVRREIRKHFRENPVARRARYSRGVRFLHAVFDNASFARFVLLYVALVVTMALAEAIVSCFAIDRIPQWAGSDVKQFLTNVTSYLLTAQATVLGVVSIAIGLVTIIAQRENASTDVQVYYHESLAFGLIASSVALLAVLCVQLLWPLQFTLHWMGFGSALLFFKALMTVVHTAWMSLNLAGLAHFVATTLAFVQQSARESQRERYTANVVAPVDMRKRLREQLLLQAGPECVNEVFPDASRHEKPAIVYFGTDFSSAGQVEVPLRSRSGIVLDDVRVIWVRWVICRWLRRCRASAHDRPERARLLAQEPMLLFPPQLDAPPQQDKGLCRRRGGVPLTRIERVVVRHAFKFRKTRHES